MKYYSTNHKIKPVSLREAVFSGLASDGGLFMPDATPQMSTGFLKRIYKLSFPEIAFEISKKLFQKEISLNVLSDIVNRSFNFPIPLIKLSEYINVLELFHGPTLAFKDFGARFMANLFAYFLESMDQEMTILVATSGDTGSAVANGFFGMKGIRVIILYPSKKVSEVQESQFTTLGGNIIALEINGTFDDCQKLVKQMFLDDTLIKKMNLTSSNSINIARLLPQSFYYFSAFAQLGKTDVPIIFSVPCGNFGNLTGGLIAKKMGLPVKIFISSTNINDTVPRYFLNGKYKPKPSKETISNAMDVGNPNNFARLLALYDSKVSKMRKNIISYSFTDKQTRSAIIESYKKYNYIPDPHGAVAFLGLKKYLKSSKKSIQGIFLETAHPAKFRETIENTLNIKIELPDKLQAALKKEKKSIPMANSFHDLKEFLLHLLWSY